MACLETGATQDVSLQQAFHGRRRAGVQLSQERHCAAVVQRALQAILRERCSCVLQSTRQGAQVVRRLATCSIHQRHVLWCTFPFSPASSVSSHSRLRDEQTAHIAGPKTGFLHCKQFCYSLHPPPSCPVAQTSALIPACDASHHLCVSNDIELPVCLVQ